MLPNCDERNERKKGKRREKEMERVKKIAPSEKVVKSLGQSDTFFGEIWCKKNREARRRGEERERVEERM